MALVQANGNCWLSQRGTLSELKSLNVYNLHVFNRSEVEIEDSSKELAPLFARVEPSARRLISPQAKCLVKR